LLAQRLFSLKLLRVLYKRGLSCHSCPVSRPYSIALLWSDARHMDRILIRNLWYWIHFFILF
jgi:hypothetical protein